MDLFKQMGEVVQEQNAKILKNFYLAETLDDTDFLIQNKKEIKKEGGDNDK